MRFTPLRLRRCSMSKLETPPGSIETIASGHSGEGMNGFVSDVPHVSTATNAPKPHANAIIIPRRLLRGARPDAASSGRTANAGFRAKRAPNTATTGATAMTAITPFMPIAAPAGKVSASHATYAKSAAIAPPIPSASPAATSASASRTTILATPPRVMPRIRSVAISIRRDSIVRKRVFTSRQSAVSAAAQRRSGFARSMLRPASERNIGDNSSAETGLKSCHSSSISATADGGRKMLG